MLEKPKGLKAVSFKSFARAPAASGQRKGTRSVANLVLSVLHQVCIRGSPCRLEMSKMLIHSNILYTTGIPGFCPGVHGEVSVRDTHKAEGRAGNQSTRMSLTHRVVLARIALSKVILEE